MNDINTLRSILDETGFAPAVELGDCMAPGIRKGERLLVEKVDASGVRVGDVIVFRFGLLLYAHRVFAKVSLSGRFFFITRGDVERVFDRPVSGVNVFGRVVGHGRDVKALGCPVIYALLAVYYLNKLIGLRVPLYGGFSGLIGRVF